MGFELKNKANETVFKNEFNPADVDKAPFRTEQLDLDLPFGHVKSTCWIFDGIRMTYSESVLHEPVVLNWTGDTEQITMHFNLQGKISILDKTMLVPYVLSDNQHNLFYGQAAEGEIKMEELKARQFLIQFSRQAFLDLAGDGNEALKRFAGQVAAGKPAAFSESGLNIGLTIQNCIQSVLNCRYTDPLKKMFLFSRTIELLVLQAESLDLSLNPKTRYIRNDYDKERILFARDYLLKHLEAPPSLTGLSRIAGLNEYKLKRGFKETFGQTVFEYLSEVRLDLAKNDLLEKRKSVTEIAFELGYSSLQHFSTAFKKKFGVSPGKVM